MCSVCFKEAVKKKQQPPSPTSSTNTSTTTSGSSGRSPSSITTVASSSSTSAAPLVTGTAISPTLTVPPSSDKDLVGGPSTSSNLSAATSNSSLNSSTAGDTGVDSDRDAEGADKDGKKKKNRCATCRKKVGLTGFECRCGGLYCSVHRYSDKHECSFNYRELGAEEIRRNNPVVVGQKIQKI